MGLVILVVVWAALIWWLLKLYRRRKFTDDGKQFRQAGVIVDYEDSTISIKGAVFPVSAVRAVEIVASGQSGVISIEVDDVAKPIRKIMVLGPDTSRAFYSRLRLALKKAGAGFD